ncbi:MAG TPA: D-alanyl-D-alanine carboxypeptidase family protein, partial [Terriglobales bacterium]|nr:D-alanyl-D-alanine carboxypeptidase family protein [Terriglobales bacterium]
MLCSSIGLSEERRPVATVAWLALAAIFMAATASAAYARVHASILVDAQTGNILETQNPDDLCYPASLTKLMTLYLTFQQLNSGKMTLEQELPVSSHAATQQPTKLYLKPGEEITVRSAILAITTRSANDAAVVLAEAIGGTEWNFAHSMTVEARELGMTHTTFRNASGLPNISQMTTARDMSKLAIAIMHKYPQYYHFFKAKSFAFRGKTINGHDHLLSRYAGVD